MHRHRPDRVLARAREDHLYLQDPLRDGRHGCSCSNASRFDAPEWKKDADALVLLNDNISPEAWASTLALTLVKLSPDKI